MMAKPSMTNMGMASERPTSTTPAKFGFKRTPTRVNKYIAVISTNVTPMNITPPIVGVPIFT